MNDSLTLPSILANAFDKAYTADRAVEDLTRLMNQASLVEIEPLDGFSGIHRNNPPDTRPREIGEG